MAAISFTALITRQNSLDVSANFGSIGGGPGASILTALAYQGTNSAARRIGSADVDHGYTITEGTSRNTTTAAFRTFGFKGFIKQRGALNAGGLKLRLGSGSSAYHSWIMGDDGTIPSTGFQYPVSGGYVLKPVDATIRAWLNTTTGNPDETAITLYAVTANVSDTANGEDLGIDALDWIETGFYLVGGDGADADGTFQSFVDNDEGEGSASFDRVALWTSNAGAIFFYGTHTIGANSTGTAVATEFTDEFTTLICPGGYVRDGFNSLVFNVSNASTIISLDNISITGSGRSGLKRLFDSVADVDTGTDVITYTNHRFRTGDQVFYSQEAGTGTVVSLTGGESQLVTGTTGAYYYVINVTINTFAVATNRANALAGTRAALSTATGIHSFTRTPDTRPNFTVTGTSGSFVLSSSNLISNRTITLDTGAAMSGVQFITCGKLLPSGGNLSNCTINNPTVWEGEAFIETTDISLISDCSFIANANDGGHAIELTATGTFSFAGNLFSGYGLDSTLNAAIYNNSGGSVTINVLDGGDTPTVRNGTGASTTINNNVSITLTGLKDNTEVRVYDSGATTELSGIEIATDGTTNDRTFSFSLAATTVIDVVILAIGWQYQRIDGFTVPTNNTTLPISQVLDRNYLNP